MIWIHYLWYTIRIIPKCGRLFFNSFLLLIESTSQIITAELNPIYILQAPNRSLLWDVFSIFIHFLRLFSTHLPSSPSQLSVVIHFTVAVYPTSSKTSFRRKDSIYRIMYLWHRCVVIAVFIFNEHSGLIKMKSFGTHAFKIHELEEMKCERRGIVPVRKIDPIESSFMFTSLCMKWSVQSTPGYVIPNSFSRLESCSESRKYVRKYRGLSWTNDVLRLSVGLNGFHEISFFTYSC